MEIEAAACVVAVPASVIGRISFDPPLPVPHREALAAIGCGHAAKLFVPLRSLPEPSAAAYSLAPSAETREILTAPLGPLAFAGEHLGASSAR